MRILLRNSIAALACSALISACATSQSAGTSEAPPPEGADAEPEVKPIDASDGLTVSEVVVGTVLGVGAALLFVTGVLVYAILSASDERLKTDIQQVGMTDDGLPIYTFRYKGDDRVWRGVIAQDVLDYRPDAVWTGPGGYLYVDYRKLGLRMEQVR